ncbi:hypothetical protein VTN77DRAFT_3322 [Rasamsonia byssochlamydoides]|uniref:uncharacterized protein n=1 Tax=Rasamsonia byssochlamydoides TaxID=89139 RepID=UPI003743C6CF
MPKYHPALAIAIAIRCVVRRRPSPRSAPTPARLRTQPFSSTRYGFLAQPYNSASPDELWFAPSSISLFSATRGQGGPDGLNGDAGAGDHKPPNERVVKLGKTLRILSPLLPTILINPLPLEILSPQITLHLFPSTHPHLPNVKGRVLYRAALWTVPVAWSSVPLVGNVKLQILSERMVRATSVLGCDHNADCGEERLVVRWRTEARHEAGGSTSTSASSSEPSSSSTHLADSKAGTNKGLSALLGGEAPIFKLGKEGHFTGLFIFAFDEEGRISSHTIEHADQADGWDRTAKFVTLTDWLLGKARGSMDPSGSAGPSLAAQGCEEYNFDSKDYRRMMRTFERL